MKKILTLFIIFFTLTSFSQEDSLSYKQDDINIFGKRTEPTKVSLYASFDFGYQQLNDENLKDNQSITVGLSVGAVLNKNFLIGIYGFTNSESLYNEYVDSYLRYGGGGLLLSVRLFTKLPIHVSIPLKAGFGTISYADNNWSYYNTSHEFDLTRDRYFIFEPGLEVEFNIVKYFKISGGLSYKMTDVIVLIDTPSNILNGWTANLSFRIIY